MTNIHAFGLLHLANGEISAMNVRPDNFDEQIRIYLNNANLLACSLHQRGIKFVLLTNAKKLLENIIDIKHSFLKIIEIECITQIPSGTKFYSAHFKLDLYRYLSQLNYDYVFFCDLDMVCLNQPSRAFFSAVERKIPLIYEVTNQVMPAVGHEKIIEDIEAIISPPSEGRWIGGEFIAGSPIFFKQLVSEIEIILPKYFERINRMHHVSDESFTTCAIEVMRRKGIYIGDAGLLGIVFRFWSVPTLHYQTPFKAHLNCFLLHLPSDKRFLSKFGKECSSFNKNKFIKKYNRYLILSKLNPIKIFRKVL